MTDQPNPFSRQGADAPGGSGAPGGSDPVGAVGGPSATEPWPSYPSEPAPSAPPVPYAQASYGQPPYDPAPYTQAPHAQPPYDPGPYAPSAPYGRPAAPADPYQQAYGQQPVPATQPNPYGTSPYGPSTYGANPYAAAAYGYTPAVHPQAVLSLVLGVLGLVVCSYVGIAAFIIGNRARKEISAQPQRYSGLGMAVAGWVMGMVGIVLAVLVTIFFVIGFAGGWDS